MKKDIDPQLYPTDSLVTSDEWYSFDYNLQTEIKELAEIGYDNKPQLCKNTFAYGYLCQVEKLLIERCQTADREIENLCELQTLIEKYDNLKTFLLTLRIATIAYRTGFIPRFVKGGERYESIREQNKENSEKSVKSRKKSPSVYFSWKDIIERGKRIKKDFPSYGPHRIAGMIHVQMEGDYPVEEIPKKGTIRKKLSTLL